MITLEQKTVAVIGATGFIGSHLVDHLLSNNCYVRAIGRNLPGLISKQSLSNPLLSTYIINLADKYHLNRSLNDVDIVIHLASASLPSDSNLNPQHDVASNLIGTLNLLDASVLNDIDKFVFISSGGTVYGKPVNVPILESHPTDPTCSYGINKLAIEKYLSLYRSLHQLNCTILRLANPYGERQRVNSSQGVVPVFLNRAIHGLPLEVWGDGTIVRDFLYISDVVDAIIKSCTYSGDDIVFNIGSGIGTSLIQLINIIEDTIRQKVTVTFKNARDFDVPTNILSIEKAHKTLGWVPQVSPPAGIANFYRYLIS